MPIHEYSQAGKATARVVNSVISSADAAYAVFNAALQFGRPSVLDQERLTAAIDLNKAASAAPRWLDVNSLLAEVMTLSTPAIWKETLRRGVPSQVEDIATAMETSVDQVPLHISEANKPLYGFTPVLALAAAFGMDIYAKGIIQDRDTKLGPWNEAIKEVAQYFATPATSVDDLMGRMRELFPDKDSEQYQYAAINIIDRTGVFDNHGQSVKCLVIRGTQHFFEAYGRALRNDAEPGDYGNDFKRNIMPRTYREQLAAEEEDRRKWEARRR